MRALRLISILQLLLLVLVVPGWAQESEDGTEVNIEATPTVWFNYVDKDSSKAEEYGEVPEGFLLKHFSADVRMKEDRYMEVRAKNVGLNNGRYGFEYGVHEKYDVYFDYTKIPHLFSKDGETIWTETRPGVWEIPDVLQQGIENLNPFPPGDPLYNLGLLAQRSFVSGLLSNAHKQDLELQRNRSTAGFTYSANTKWKYGIEYFHEQRDGTRPFGTSLGFSWATELPERIEYDTDRVRAGVEFAGKGKSFSAYYDLSLFNNAVETMTWDNPLRFNDRTYDSAYSPGDGTSRGRVKLPADNTANTISFAGASKVGQGKLTGSFAYSQWTDEVDLLPFTINTAIEEIPLPASTFNGKIKNINANLRYNTPVGRHGSFTAAYRLYDQKNDNDQFNIGRYVRFDQVEELLERFDCTETSCTAIENPPTPLFAYTTNNLDFDFHLGLSSSFRWFVGYNYDHRTLEDREIESTDTNTFKTGVDVFASDRVTLRAQYQYATRSADGFENDNPTYLIIPLRRIDIADYKRDLVRAIADFGLSDSANLGFSAQYIDTRYSDDLIPVPGGTPVKPFGVSDLQTWSLGVDFSYSLPKDSTFNAFYEHTSNESDQTGRQSGSTPSTTTAFDWTAFLTDDFDTFGLGYTLNLKESKGLWYNNIAFARANGDSTFTAGSLLRLSGAVDLRNVDDTDLLTFKTGVNWQCFKRTKIGVQYRFDYYTIDDYAENAIQTDLIFVTVNGVPSTPGTILLNARQPDYTYHTGWIGLIYSW